MQGERQIERARKRKEEGRGRKRKRESEREKKRDREREMGELATKSHRAHFLNGCGGLAGSGPSEASLINHALEILIQRGWISNAKNTPIKHTHTRLLSRSPGEHSSVSVCLIRVLEVQSQTGDGHKHSH